MLATLAAIGILGAGVSAALIGVGNYVTGTNLPQIDIGVTGSIDVSATGDLNVTASPQTILFAPQTPHAISGGQLAISIRVSADGGTFVGTGIGGNDIVIAGTTTDGSSVYSGTLLTGRLLQFGFQNGVPGTHDVFDFRFQVTGGSLQPLFQNADLGVYLFAELGISNWPNGSAFATPFNSGPSSLKGAGTVTVPYVGSVGDFVWHDVNGNGVQEPGEPGINGVPVTLTGTNPNGGGAILQNTTTTNSPQGAPGWYQFTGLPATTYTVTVNATALTSAGFQSTSATVGTDRTIDSNGHPATVVLPVVTGGVISNASMSDQTIDFGFRTTCTGVIGDLVWQDTTPNNRQDSGEPGIDGMRVTLTGIDNTGQTVSRSTVTGPDGTYRFTGLCPSSSGYTVTVDASTRPGFTPVTPQAAGSTPANDSNGSPTVVILPTTLGEMTDVTVDFGFVASPCTGVIGDVVWHDIDGDGLKGSGEPGIDGVRLRLYTIGGSLVRSAISHPNSSGHGFYQFHGLCANTYKIVVDVPTGFVATTAFVNSSPNCDTDAQPNGSQGDPNDSNGCQPNMITPVATTYVTTDGSTTDSTIDFGFWSGCALTIGDFVWNDQNGNGLQESEAGIPGATVNLRRPSDYAVIQTAVTDSTGHYQMTGLCPGNYVVEAVPPAGYDVATTTPANPRPLQLTTSVNTVDFGFTKTTGQSGGDPETPDYCYVGTVNPSVTSTQDVTINQTTGTATIRTTFSKNFADNTYGTGAVGWGSKGHTFSNLTGSDHLQLALYDNAGAKKLEFKLDLITATSSAPSGYGTLCVSGGEGSMIVGSSANVVSCKTSISENLNALNYRLTTNSPATNASYAPNATYPNWIFDTWYEVTVKLSAFGTSGFGRPMVTGIHASPSKTGSNTEPVATVSCVPPPPPTPVLAVTKVADGSGAKIVEGNPIGFTITATNPGTVAVSGVSVTDPLPTGTGIGWSVASSTGFASCAINANTLSCSAPSLAPQGSATVRVVSATTTGSAKIYPNTASATGTGAATVTASASVEVVPPGSVDTPDFCYVGTVNPSVTSTQDVTINQTAGTATIRTTFSKNFADNTYGTSAIGWGSKGHKFSDLTGSDHLQLALYDNAGAKKLEFKVDLITATSVPSGYGTLCVSGGEGSMIVGSSADVVSCKTSISENLNALNYRLTTNSPVTNTSYAPNATYPNWIFDTWYEVTVKLSAFGTSGFGRPMVTGIHASPSKTGSNTEPVVPTACVPSTAPPPTTPPPSGGSCQIAAGAVTFKSDQVLLPLTNNGSQSAVLSGLDLAWLQSTNGKLKYVKLDSDNAWSPGINSPASLSSSGLTTTLSKKSVAAGQTRTLVLQFEKTASTNKSTYSGTVKFDNGCQIALLP